MNFIIIFIISMLNADISPGYTLYSPFPNQAPSDGYNTYLIDNNENIINQWNHDCRPVSIAYLLPDSSIIIPCTQNQVEGLGENGMSGGRILKFSWDGETLWDDIFIDNTFQPHHDIEPLPNGNILFISYERKTYEDAIDMGRMSISDEIWPSYIFELQQISLDSSQIVWEWHLWDHTIQNIDSTLSNYGIISQNPGLLNINLGTLGGGGGASGDWIHLNSIDYNEGLDIIAISSRKMNEFYFIDHSTTTAESATHLGGIYNKGGDFIYRWGNPENYNRGEGGDQVLFSQHSVNWINENYPGGGDIILFNNRTEEVGSEILQIRTGIDFTIDEFEAFGPSTPQWNYGNGSFFSNVQSGAFRLENGNTFISIGSQAHFFEIDSTENIVWDYTHSGPSGQLFNGNIPRAQKYDIDYLLSGLIGDLNSDLMVNILDVILLVDLILNEDDEFAYSDFSDINQDGLIDILDIIMLINIILEN